MVKPQQMQPAVEPTPRLAYTPDVVAKMRVAVGKEIDEVRANARNQIARLQQAITETDAQMRWEVAQWEQAMRDIDANAAPDPGAFPNADDLADDPKKNLDAIANLHIAQDAREGVQR
ncbi:hypothetical protein ABT340_41360 [Streptosporangium sp. NPDC000239]|uniref:hypothetical protein n=1 Tax=Streptosporangium sp. NPDC000239 TaxID=3154248 RepID=UPI0033167E04